MTKKEGLVLNMSKGFTLLEALIYIALFGLILTGVVTSAYPLITGADRLSSRVLEESESAFVLQKIEYALSSAAGVAVSGGNILTVTPISGTPLVFTLGGGAITLNGTALTASRTTFAAFSANKTDPSPGLHVVTVSFSLDGETYSQTYNVFY